MAWLRLAWLWLWHGLALAWLWLGLALAWLGFGMAWLNLAWLWLGFGFGFGFGKLKTKCRLPLLAQCTCATCARTFTIYSSTMVITRKQFDAIPLTELISQRYIDKIHHRAKNKILVYREYMAPSSRRVDLRSMVVRLTCVRVNKVRQKIYIL